MTLPFWSHLGYKVRSGAPQFSPIGSTTILRGHHLTPSSHLTLRTLLIGQVAFSFLGLLFGSDSMDREASDVYVFSTFSKRRNKPVAVD